MLTPLLLGYVVGAVGIYALLYKLSPVVTDDYVMQSSASSDVKHVEVIELFPVDQSTDKVKAA